MADYRYIVDTGVIVPDASETRKDVEDDFRSAFGSDLNTDPSTPQGVLITMIAEERDSIARNNAQLANQINPEIAGGIFLDAIWKLSGGERRSATPVTLLNVALTGTANTLIPAGSVALTAQGARFLLKKDVKLDAGGAGVGDFEASTLEDFSVSAHDLNIIGTVVTGWTGVDNPSQSIPMQPEESDTQARRRRRQTMAFQTVGTNEAIRSRLMSIPTVRSINYLENYESTTQTIKSVSLVAHSVWACVEGGYDAEVAQALFESKTVGAAYNGDVTVNVTDPHNQRSYQVKFSRPVDVNVILKVTVKSSGIDLASLIPKYVMNYVNGLVEGDVSFVVGVDVSPFEIAAAINMQNPSITVTKVEVSKASPVSWSTNVLSMNANQIARITESGITVIIV